MNQVDNTLNFNTVEFLKNQVIIGNLACENRC